MHLAWSLLPPDGLIASSDADTVVAPDWLARQLDAVAAGADAVGGWIELDEAELHPWVVEHRAGARASGSPACAPTPRTRSTTTSPARRWR